MAMVMTMVMVMTMATATVCHISQGRGSYVVGIEGLFSAEVVSWLKCRVGKVTMVKYYEMWSRKR